MKKGYNYTGIGICFGSGIGTLAAVLIFVFTRNPVYFSFIGAGSAIGLIFGAALDSHKQSGKNKDKE